MNYWRFSLFQELACSHIRRIPSQGIMVRITSWQGQYRIEKKGQHIDTKFLNIFSQKLFRSLMGTWWACRTPSRPGIYFIFIHIYNFIYIHFKFLYLFIISVKFISNFCTYLLFHLYLFHICCREFPWSLTVNIIILATNFLCIVKISMTTSIQN